MSDASRHRNLAVRLAYDITGSWADAEEIAQEALARVWMTTEVRDPRALLARITTNLAIDRLRTSRTDYVGPYLPEPVLTSDGADEAVERAAEVEVALLVALEALSPIERATLLLHDVFAFSFDEVAEFLDRSPAAVRQAASRARAHAARRRPRFTHDDATTRQLVERFFAAVRDGEVAQLVDLLATDVTLVSDGGGAVAAARRPVVGSEQVARFLAGLGARFAGRVTIAPAHLNRADAHLVFVDGALDQVVWLGIHEGRIEALYLVRNPAKLRAV
ncbi:sigma-70 family RNA polymerase sigma factor [Arachnia propionica]|uniref:Sigma-70 family RNA polymerase sigma factor n=1 Tax=Arachnia propionica TaxID=1750 RepID=A0A3P1T417_9ACTN|nr:sigma-70 family RNA polymerase sigma factor [Arachnia propionica]MDO5083614.1 sigma-70 family RNA polymerase sigma factor [Arachnia propionica]RRD04267.1 sigma-70 family RNA polymerase sigma factor [Arachnia propionica]